MLELQFMNIAKFELIVCIFFCTSKDYNLHQILLITFNTGYQVKIFRDDKQSIIFLSISFSWTNQSACLSSILSLLLVYICWSYIIKFDHLKLSFPFKMSHASTENDFENLLRLALPLIKNRNEPNFDRMLSKWMGRNIHTEYSNWKDSKFGSAHSVSYRSPRILKF